MSENKVISVREYKKLHPELKGKRILLCEHLKNKSIDNVNLNLFLGDNTRVLLCPVCSKVCDQTAWEHIASTFLMIMDVSKKMEYKNWLETAGKG